jgi:hypothetical protein
VAHNWAASFNSTLNYYFTDYGMGHICRVAVETGTPKFQYDLLSGKASPKIFLTEPVRLSLAEYRPKFIEILKKEIPGAPPVRAASFEVTFDLPRVVRSEGQTEFWVPCTLKVSINDDQGNSHEAEIVENWPVSRQIERPPATIPRKFTEWKDRLRQLVRK